MLKIIFTFFFFSLSIVSFSQAASLVTRFTVSDDIASISGKIQVPQIRVSVSSDNISATINSCYNRTCNALAVQLISLDAKRISNQKVSLTWKTTNEINNKGFAIQRSFGSASSFSDVGYVGADQFSAVTHEYEFDDDNDFVGISYYRLRQIDLDNHFLYSRIVSVQGYSFNESLSVYPNPAISEVSLKVQLNKPDIVTISIFDKQGRLLHLQSGHMMTGENSRNLKIMGYSNGMYTVKVLKNDGTLMVTKFIKY